MKISRMDLDTAATPGAFVSKILTSIPDFPIPSPVEELCTALDIVEIAPLKTNSFEGGLLTQPEKTNGIILVNQAAPIQRQRFTIGHELYHFLSPWHQPVQAGEFLCDRQAMSEWDSKSQDKYKKMEAEANEFSAMILMPPPKLRLAMKDFKEPNMSDILILAKLFHVSKEAAARAYAQYSDHPLAIVIAQNGKVLRSYRSHHFPLIPFTKVVPNGSRYHTKKTSDDWHECPSYHWIEDKVEALHKQVVYQRDGFAMIMLWAELSEEKYDADENKTSKQRFSDRISKWNGH